MLLRHWTSAGMLKYTHTYTDGFDLFCVWLLCLLRLHLYVHKQIQ